MPLETAAYISDLESANPAGTDQLAQGDEHIRLIKATLLATFPNITGAITKTQDELNDPDYLVPIGAITMWYGTEITVPVGWAVCNGQIVTRTDGGGVMTTPDLRDRVVVGAGTIAAQGTTAGATTSAVTTGSAGSHTHTISGGEHTHTGSCSAHALTVDELPAHSHLIAVDGDTTGTLTADNFVGQANNITAGDTQYRLKGSTSNPNVGKSGTSGTGAGHTHPIALDSAVHSHTVSTADAHTHSVTTSTLQPSMGLHYIMRY